MNHRTPVSLSRTEQNRRRNRTSSCVQQAAVSPSDPGSVRKVVEVKVKLLREKKKRNKENMSKPNYSGTFHMVEQENMDAYLEALDINFALRKIVCLLKPTKDITHDPATGAMKIRTLTTFKNFHMDFTIGQEFTEDLGPVDGRTCQTTVSWEGDKLVCVQRGEKEGRGWTHWLDGDKLHLEMRVQGIVAKQLFKKAD